MIFIPEPNKRRLLLIIMSLSAFVPGVGAFAEANGGQTILPGANSKQPVNIEADKLDYFDKDQKLIYEGNVLATQGESRLKASRLVIFLAPKMKNNPDVGASSSNPPASPRDMRRMEATGPVTLISKDQVGTGDNGVYDKSENKVYLNGNVTLSQNGNVTKGDRLIYDLRTSQALVSGHIRSMFLPNGSADNMSVKKPQSSKPPSQPTAKLQ
jgi:lipopolysaccharide export system protein LptA